VAVSLPIRLVIIRESLNPSVRAWHAESKERLGTQPKSSRSRRAAYSSDCPGFELLGRVQAAADPNLTASPEEEAFRPYPFGREPPEGLLTVLIPDHDLNSGDLRRPVVAVGLWGRGGASIE
jgi:hypothetical protein